MAPRDARALWLVRNVLPHEGALRAWLRGKSVPGIDVDDIIQESYARLSSLDSIGGIRDPRTYFFQTAHSILVSTIRRSRIVQILALEHIEAFEMPSGAPDIETQVNDRQELQRLAQAIASLPGKIRDVFILRRVHGLSQREVAQRVGLTESTVEKHMSKGFRTIATQLGRSGNAPSQASREKPESIDQDHAPDSTGD